MYPLPMLFSLQPVNEWNSTQELVALVAAFQNEVRLMQQYSVWLPPPTVKANPYFVLQIIIKFRSAYGH